jgi:hypothetical protein
MSSNTFLSKKDREQDDIYWPRWKRFNAATIFFKKFSPKQDYPLITFDTISNNNNDLKFETIMKNDLEKLTCISIPSKQGSFFYSDVENGPFFSEKIEKKTSQGRVSLAKMIYPKTKEEFTIVLKMNEFPEYHTKFWYEGDHRFDNSIFNMITKKQTINIFTTKKEEISRRILSSSIMDALCLQVFSRAVEDQKSPHFPFCYGSFLHKERKSFHEYEKEYAKKKRKEMETKTTSKIVSDGKKPRTKIITKMVSKKRKTEMKHQESSILPLLYKNQADIQKLIEDKNTIHHKLNQCMWMEYLPMSSYEVLKNEKNVDRWWAAIFQISAGLLFAQHYFGFVHNDFHAENVRVKIVDQESFLYYRLLNKRILRVPTFGNVFIIIDFGRSFIKYNGIEWISSEFTSSGQCSGYICNNPSIDMIRFISSVEQKSKFILPEEDEKLLREMFYFIAMSDRGCDDHVIDLINNKTDKEFQYALEEFPRKFCHRGEPQHYISKLFQLYEYKGSIPKGQVVYNLPI